MAERGGDFLLPQKASNGHLPSFLANHLPLEDSVVGEWIRRMNSPPGSALEPGRKHSYYFRYTDFSELSPLKGKPIHTLYPIGVQVDDEVGNSYTEDLPDDFRNSFLEYIPLHLHSR